MKQKWTGFPISLLLPLLLAGCATTEAPPLPLASNVDLTQMYGGWYIVATIPNWFEKGMVAPYDVYSPRPDGLIAEDFYFQEGGFGGPRRHLDTEDEVEPDSGGAAWRVHIFGPVKLPFLLIYVDPSYRFALFGERGRDLGWIYSRDPILSDEDYLTLKSQFASVGYDVSKFRKFVQIPEQIGKPGYWSEDILP
jgi:apolipoprotein D and lipocalin family protein